MIGLSFLNPGARRDDALEEIRWFHRAAEQGQALAQRYLGTLSELGRGVAQNLQQAFFWHSRQPIGQRSSQNAP